MEDFLKMDSYSIIKRTRREKLMAMAASLAISIAKQRNDPMYQKHKVFKERFVDLKKKIFSRYRIPALRLAKQRMRESMNNKSNVASASIVNRPTSTSQSKSTSKNTTSKPSFLNSIFKSSK